METQTTITQHHKNQITGFCPFQLQEQENTCEYATANTYEEFLKLLRKVFYQLDMGQAFKKLPME